MSTYHIAELGVAHCGDPEKLHGLVDIFMDRDFTHVDALKFQLHTDRDLAPGHIKEDQIAALRLSDEDLLEAAVRASEKYHVIFSAFSEYGFAALNALQEEIDLDGVKIPSPEAMNPRIVKYVRDNFPCTTYISTGFMDVLEVRSFDFFGMIPFHCVSRYPAYNIEIDRLAALVANHPHAKGFSDHSPPITQDTMAFAALAAGCTVFERHVGIYEESPDSAVEVLPWIFDEYAGNIEARARDLFEGAGYSPRAEWATNGIIEARNLGLSVPPGSCRYLTTCRTGPCDAADAIDHELPEVLFHSYE